MKYSDEVLMAYADGELDAATRAEIEAAATADPELAAAIARHLATRDQLGRAFDPILEEPVPSRLLEALGPDAMPRPAAEPTPLPARHRQWSWPEWGAMAATLLLGALIGAALRTTPDPVLERQGDGVFAAGALSEALSVQLAQEATPGDGIRPGLSFRTVAGEYCRTFSLGRTAGLACRDPERWRIDMLATSPEVEVASYRLAGVEFPPALLEVIEAQIDGDPLDAAGEAAARDRGWRD